MDKLKAFESFVSVATRGSLTAAARAEGVAPAIMGRRLDALEEHLGVKLMVRTTRRISLTHEGSAFLEDCQRLLTDVSNAEASVSAGGVKAAGHLRITAPAGFGRRHVAPLVPWFREQHPDVTVTLNLSDRVVDIVEEGFDLAIRITQLQNSSLISRRLASARMVLCASPTYLARQGTPVHPSELVQHHILAYSYWSSRDEWAFDGPDGVVVVKTTPCLRSNNGDTCRAVALAHEGIILQPSFMVGADLAAGTLVELCPGYRALEMGIHAVYSSRKHVAPKVRLLIDFLVEHFAEPRWPG